jgi:hypothetical protein
LMMARMRLDEKLAINLPPDHAERTARMLLQRIRQVRQSRETAPKGRGHGSQVT